MRNSLAATHNHRAVTGQASTAQGLPNAVRAYGDAAGGCRDNVSLSHGASSSRKGPMFHACTVSAEQDL
jgi:hypothetical protein